MELYTQGEHQFFENFSTFTIVFRTFSVSGENPYFSVFHKLNSKCSLHRKSIFLYADDSFHIAYVPQQWLQIPDGAQTKKSTQPLKLDASYQLHCIILFSENIQFYKRQTEVEQIMSAQEGKAAFLAEAHRYLNSLHPV